MRRIVYILLFCALPLAGQNVMVIPYTAPEGGEQCAESRWYFENSGDDEEGNNTITLNGGANYGTSSPKQGSYYLNCNGSGYYADVPQINFGDNFTISFWFRKGTFTGYPILFDAASSNNGFHIQIDAANNRFRIFSGNGSDTDWAFSNSVTLTTNVWHHVVVVFDRTAGECTIYFNNNDVTATDNSTRTDFANNVTSEIGSTTLYAYAVYDAFNISLWAWDSNNVDTEYTTAGSEICED